MRLFSLAILATGMICASLSAQAQTYDPSYPVCLQVYGRINYIDCRYTSLPQCNASASGRPAQCIINPYYADAPPARRTNRARSGY